MKIWRGKLFFSLLALAAWGEAPCEPVLAASAPSVSPVSAAASSAAPARLPGGNDVEPGWQRVYQAGGTDPEGHYLGGSNIIHIVGRKGKLYAANSYWCDSRNIWYGGTDPETGWAQVLRLDQPGGRWAVDLELGPKHLRTEILKSVTFRTDGAGRPLETPVNLLLAGTHTLLPDHVEVSIFARDDATGKWTRGVAYSGPKGDAKGEFSTRAMCLHRDKVTGVDRVFLTIGSLGIFSGVYDPAALGQIKWDAKSESGPVEMRPLAIAEANGDLYFSAGRQIDRRNDGEEPSWKLVHDLSDIYPNPVTLGCGGIRGLSAVPNPGGKGESLIFAMSEGGKSRGYIYRLDPAADGGFMRVKEVCLADLMKEYLGGNPVEFILAAYNDFHPVTDPTTGETVHLLGFESTISGHRFPTWGGGPRGGFYAGSMVAIRDAKGHYRLKEVNGRITLTKPVLVNTYSFALSPFEADHGQIIYFAGHDQNGRPSHDMAWIFSTKLDGFLKAEPENADH
jgi:hypothetical protein